MITLEFPWPPAALSPNARVHWRTKHKFTKQYGSECFMVCRFEPIEGGCCAMRSRPKLPNNSLAITFHPPSKRRADLDNMLASFKPGIDAISQFTGIDDSKFTYTISKSSPVKGGAVRVVIG